MVSLWPWRGDDTSPASFERALSALSTKISKTTTLLDSLRQRSRRLKALWTLYSSFAYILYAIVLALVLGWRNWGALEYGGVAAGPALIYLVRLLLTTYYNYRISNVTSRLQELQKERETTIERLKAATKYDSTLQLLEKYGGAPQKAPPTSSSSEGKAKGSPRGAQGKENLDGQRRIVPPPTANIPRNQPLSPQPATPQQQSIDKFPSPARGALPPPYPGSPSPAGRPGRSSPVPGPAEFAPNAFGDASQALATHSDEAKWYDRVLDLLLGEDETLPRNRLALICTHCRLVNGQAPPGVKRLEDVGKWRCSGCGSWNGEENEAKKIVAEVREQAKVDTESALLEGGIESSEDGHTVEDSVVLVPDGEDASGDDNQDSNDLELKEEENDDGRSVTPPLPKPKRGRPKGSGKRKA